MPTEILRPNAAGDEENITAVVGDGIGTHYTVVDEVVADDDTSYLLQTGTTYYRDLYNLGAPSGSGVINWIKVWYRFRNTSVTYDAYCMPAIKTGGTAYNGSESIQPANDLAYDNYSYQWVTNPQTGVAWTWADLIALQAGVSLKMAGGRANSRCTQIYVEIDYLVAIRSQGYIL